MSSSSDKKTPPRFQQIVAALRADILDGSLAEHNALPSERALAEQYAVSRMTARRALESVEAGGLAYAKGRRGRFVSPQRLLYDISKTVSFAASTNGIDLKIDLIDAKTTTASAALGSQLAIPAGEPIFEYTRLFRSRQHPVFLETEYVIASRVPNFFAHDLRQSTSKLMETAYGIFAYSGDIAICLRSLAADEAKYLEMAPNQAGIELAQIINDASGTAFCLGRQIWRGELAKFTAHAVLNP